YLINSIHKEMKRHTSHGTIFRNSFRKGAAFGVRAQVILIMKNREKIDDIDVPTGTALVLKNYYANEMSLNSTFLDDHGIKLNKGSKTNISDFNGYTVGKDFGNNISLNTQINGKVKINKRLT
ncbi:hypothetical protein LCGC14_2720980, partial [marine sediment metagenome]